MQTKTPETVTLIKLETKSFENDKKEKVTYREFTILDENNEMIEGTCRNSVEIPDLEKGDSINGIAILNVVPNKDKDAKPKTFKIKLVAFNE